MVGGRYDSFCRPQPSTGEGWNGWCGGLPAQVRTPARDPHLVRTSCTVGHRSRQRYAVPRERPHLRTFVMTDRANGNAGEGP